MCMWQKEQIPYNLIATFTQPFETFDWLYFEDKAVDTPQSGTLSQATTNAST